VESPTEGWREKPERKKMMNRRDLNVPFSAMSRAALVEKCQEQSDELERVRGSLVDTMDRNAEFRTQNTKLVRVKKKKKGSIDTTSKKRIREMTLHTIMSNCISNVIWIPSAIAAGEYSHMMLMAAVTTSVLQPIQMYIQKRQEVH